MWRFTPLGALLVLAICQSPVQADPHEARIPLRDGKVHIADLSAAICQEIDLPGLKLGGDVDISGFTGSLFVAALNASLGDGLRIAVDSDALVLHFDPDKLPRTINQDRRAIRKFVQTDYPEATARQARQYGLFLPPYPDERRPLIVLVHGLDTGMGVLLPMGGLLQNDGYQVAYFVYPSDQSITESSAYLAAYMIAVHDNFPAMKVDLIAHSMGGLVARSYVEGDRYVGGIDRLFLIGTPNRGSTWAKIAFIQKIQEHYQLWRDDKDWSPSWFATEGLGEAARDLKPGSTFLRRLNARPRRAGVRYTVIAGDQSPVARVESKMLNGIAHSLSGSEVWGLRHLRSGLENAADRLGQSSSPGDGPVKVSSAKLKGVDDVVLVHADHCALYVQCDGAPPASWPAIRERLAR